MATTYTDIDVFGRRAPSGGLIILTGDDALENSMLHYLGSSGGSFVREPFRAGIFDNLLYSPVRELSANEVSDYAEQISNTFSAFARIISLSITPDTESATFSVRLGWSSVLTGEQRDTLFYLKSTVSPSEQLYSYIGIENTGDSLYYFSMVQQPSMPEIKLEYNKESSQWLYGKYWYMNFTTSDPRYDDIIALIG